MPNDFIGQLIDATVRASGVALLAFTGLVIFRARSSAVRHSVWTMVLTGMLLQMPLAMVVTSIPIAARGNEPEEPASVWPVSLPSRRGSPSTLHPTEPSTTGGSLASAVSGIYAGLALLLSSRTALGFWRLRRILRSARPLPELGRDIFESAQLPAPGAVGWLRPKILLPTGWREWDSFQLRSVLAHESAHLRRWDWLVRIAAEINTSLFWFHPLAWWMRRELDRLAEEACDDAAIAEVNSRESYVAVLAAIAQGVQQRLGYRAVFMAKESTVERRVGRILASRYAVPKPIGRFGSALLLLSGITVVYLSAALDVAAAQATGAMCILIDNSGSMQEKTDRAKAIALAVVNGLERGAEIRIRHFDDEVFGGTNGFTRDREALRAALVRIDSRGGKAMRDAVRASLEELAPVQRGRRAIVLITEGFDTSSRMTLEDLLPAVSGSGVRVISVGLLSEDPARASEAATALRRVAQASGGLALFPARLDSSGAIAGDVLRGVLAAR